MSYLIVAARTVVVGICLGLVIGYRADVGWTGLGIMLAALLGLLAVLASYNRRYR
ncbi:DUF6903 family protein [Actinoplanes derwentensis]|uniref:Uncharacterized protein n=1 Tax=Actinoplanes derwentensis TaxID=113562 RepID=A0A1H2DEP0_9ACTN|nr:hypothetical protein [Actinoplanes derwentensis]GID84804.1 hypothetical protein Ade03nite_37280 [Actinoplanes derwentensis]SDT81054.1 hypothetical protein SAMN04489716_9475 [Actinoplanes derwentensis]